MVSVSISFISPLSNLFFTECICFFSVNTIQTFNFVPRLNSPVTCITLVLSLVPFTVHTVTVTLNTELTHAQGPIATRESRHVSVYAFMVSF